MTHDASHHPSVSGADPQGRLADEVARYGAKTVLFLVLGVLLFALGDRTKGPALARILGRLRKRHLDLIVGRVVDGLRLAEELRRRDAERREAEVEAGVSADDAERAEVAPTPVTEPRTEVVSLSTHRRHGFTPRPNVRRHEFRSNISRGPPPRMALAA